VPFHAQAGTALARIPRVVKATVAEFRAESWAARLPIVVAAGVILAIAMLGVALAVNTLWRVVTLPARIRSRQASGNGVAVAVGVFEVAMGAAGFFACLSAVMIVMLVAESMFTRKGSFSGAGAAVVWPAPSR
jgi:hypothetical protein